MSNASIPTEPDFWERSGLTPSKAGLIGFLVLILFVVIAVQIPWTATSSPQPDLAAKPKRPLPKRPKQTPQKSRKREPKALRKIPRPLKQVQRPEIRPATISLSSIQNSSAGKSKVASWPNVTIEDAIANDPFALHQTLRPVSSETVPVPGSESTKPSALDRAKEVARRNQELERLQLLENQKLADQMKRKRKLAEKKRKLDVIQNLQKQGVSMFFEDGSDRFVKIGQHTLRKGDVFDGIQVLDIRSDGSVLLKPSGEQLPSRKP